MYNYLLHFIKYANVYVFVWRVATSFKLKQRYMKNTSTKVSLEWSRALHSIHFSNNNIIDSFCTNCGNISIPTLTKTYQAFCI